MRVNKGHTWIVVGTFSNNSIFIFYNYSCDVYPVLTNAVVPAREQVVSASWFGGISSLQVSLSLRPYRAECTWITPVSVAHQKRNSETNHFILLLYIFIWGEKMVPQLRRWTLSPL